MISDSVCGMRIRGRFGERVRPELQLLGKRGGQIEIVLEIGARAIGTQCALWQRGQLVRGFVVAYGPARLPL